MITICHDAYRLDQTEQVRVTVDIYHRRVCLFQSKVIGAIRKRLLVTRSSDCAIGRAPLRFRLFFF